MNTWKCYLIFLIIILINMNFVQNQIFQSIMTIQNIGTDFIPANPIELLATYTGLSTVMSCFNKCNLNPSCRTFVSDNNWPFTCRLYQGSINTGTITTFSISSSTLQVGGLQYDTSLYIKYNQVCNPSLPLSDRYLICNKQSVWTCPTSTFWNGYICVNQVYYQAFCNMNEMCREDINLICSLSCQKCLCRSTTIWNGTTCGKSINFFFF